MFLPWFTKLSVTSIYTWATCGKDSSHQMAIVGTERDFCGLSVCIGLADLQVHANTVALGGFTHDPVLFNLCLHKSICCIDGGYMAVPTIPGTHVISGCRIKFSLLMLKCNWSRSCVFIVNNGGAACLSQTQINAVHSNSSINAFECVGSVSTTPFLVGVKIARGASIRSFLGRQDRSQHIVPALHKQIK